MSKRLSQNATIVTSFINLYRYESDRTEKSLEIYIEKGRELMRLDLPMVIFCEKQEYHALLKYRHDCGLGHKTIVIPVSITNQNDVPANKFRARMIEVQAEKRKQVDSLPLFMKNAMTMQKFTINYYIVMYSKSHWLNHVAKMNPFNTSRFAWIDFAISHVAGRIEEQFDWLDKIPEQIHLSEIKRFYTRQVDVNDQLRDLEGASGYAGGLITGAAPNIAEFYDFFMNTVQDMLDRGFIFLDEPVYTYLVFKNPDKFDVHYGGYDAILRDYSEPYAITKDHNHKVLREWYLDNAFNASIHDDNAYAMSIINRISKAVIDDHTYFGDYLVFYFIKVYLMAKWYVEPIGLIEDYMIKFIIEILESPRAKNIRPYIFQTTYIKFYNNNQEIIKYEHCDP